MVDSANFLSQLLRRIRDGVLEHDVVFIVDGVRFPNHRLVAAAASPVLRAMFTTGMRGANERDITLRDLDTVTWKKVNKFIYTGTILFGNINDALDILECSIRLQIDALKDRTVAFLRLQMLFSNIRFNSIDDAVNILEYSPRFQIEQLKQQTALFLNEHLKSDSRFRFSNYDDVFSILECSIRFRIDTLKDRTVVLLRNNWLMTIAF